MSDLHERAAKALGWSVHDAQSLSMQSLRDLVRTVDPNLANEISHVIQSGAYITKPVRREDERRGRSSTRRRSHATLKKGTFKVELPDGTIATRSSEQRIYTHAVVVQITPAYIARRDARLAAGLGATTLTAGSRVGECHVVTWSQSEANAQKAAHKAVRDYPMANVTVIKVVS